jgi:hypothetical protein
MTSIIIYLVAVAQGIIVYSIPSPQVIMKMLTRPSYILHYISKLIYPYKHVDLLILYSYPFYFLAIKWYNPLQAGLAMLLLLFMIIISGMITGCLVTWFNNYHWPVHISWFLGAVLTGMVMIWRENDSAEVWVLTYVISSLGQGAILNAQNFAS